MIKKTITYLDYDGQERTEDFYFHLSKADLTEMRFSALGGLEKHLAKIVNEADSGALIEHFKFIIQKAYGVKSLDGKKFVKTKEALDDFIYTEAYSDLFMELATDEKAAVEFVKGILPELPEPKEKDKQINAKTE